VTSLFYACALAVSAALLFPQIAFAQSNPSSPSAPVAAQLTDQQPNVPAGARQAEAAVEGAVRRFRIGVSGGVAIDPELIDFGAHAAFSPIFHPGIEFRPGVEFGMGEVTTMLAINLDVLYTLGGTATGTRWLPYIGAGPSFGLSHRGFETDETDHVTPGAPTVDTRNRFDFSDTDFNGGFNFIAGARSQGGTFFELKATAWGVSTIRLLAGFNF
jgi:hypothetical protein